MSLLLNPDLCLVRGCHHSHGDHFKPGYLTGKQAYCKVEECRCEGFVGGRAVFLAFQSEGHSPEAGEMFVEAMQASNGVNLIRIDVFGTGYDGARVFPLVMTPKEARWYAKQLAEAADRVESGKGAVAPSS